MSRTVQSVSRAIDILEALSESAGRMRLGEIASRAHLKPNTAHNLLKTMIEKGYVEKVSGPAYSLGPGALQLTRAGNKNHLFECAGEEMRGLQRLFPEATVVLSQRIGGNILVRLRLSPDRPGILQKPQGMTFHPYSTASGLALLAFMPREESDLVMQEHPFYEYGAHLWNEPEQLESFFSRVYREGIAMPPFRKQSSWPVAAPVLDHWGNALAAIGASLPMDEEKINEEGEQLASAVIEAAEKLSNTTIDKQKVE